MDHLDYVGIFGPAKEPPPLEPAKEHEEKKDPPQDPAPEGMFSVTGRWH